MRGGSGSGRSVGRSTGCTQVDSLAEQDWCSSLSPWREITYEKTETGPISFSPRPAGIRYQYLPASSVSPLFRSFWNLSLVFLVTRTERACGSVRTYAYTRRTTTHTTVSHRNHTVSYRICATSRAYGGCAGECRREIGMWVIHDLAHSGDRPCVI